MAPLNETDIVARIRNGEVDAFAQIVEFYQAPIIRYLYRMTGDYSMAQDLAQETFVNAYKGILKNDSDLSFRAWLYRIATNNARQYHRRNQLLSFIPFAHFSGDSTLSHKTSSDDIEQEVVVQDILLRIPYDQQQCMILHFIEGLKYREIGEILGLSEDAVRMRVARGREAFRREYGLRMGGEVR